MNELSDIELQLHALLIMKSYLRPMLKKNEHLTRVANQKIDYRLENLNYDITPLTNLLKARS